MKQVTMKFPLALSVALLLCAAPAHAESPEKRKVYFGDTHVHTSLSADAGGGGTFWGHGGLLCVVDAA